MKNTNVEVIGLNVSKNDDGNVEHTVVSNKKFKSYEEAGRIIDQHKMKGMIFIGIGV